VSRRLALLLTLLALASTLATVQRMVVMPGDGLENRLLLSERLMLAGQFCDPLPAGARRLLLWSSRQLETDPSRLAVLAGSPLSRRAMDELSPGYRLLALYRAAPSDELRLQLKVMASAGLLRLNLVALLLGGLALLTMLSLVLGERGPALPRPVGWEAPAVVLGLYWCWDAATFFGGQAISAHLPGRTGAFAGLLLLLAWGDLCLLALLAVALARRRRSRPAEDVGARRARLGLSWSSGWIGPGYLACLLAIPMVERLSEWLLGGPLPEGGLVVYLLFRASPWERAALAVLAILVQPFFEELLFRGWLAGGLEANWGRGPAIAVSAALFALVHGDPAHLLSLFALGAVLGWVYLRSRSLGASLAVHAMWNATSFCLLLANGA
jgi:membrane protease YdiL (CAAX protease family)